jgi:hypothetical protein
LAWLIKGFLKMGFLKMGFLKMGFLKILNTQGISRFLKIMSGFWPNNKKYNNI